MVNENVSATFNQALKIVTFLPELHTERQEAFWFPSVKN